MNDADRLAIIAAEVKKGWRWCDWSMIQNAVADRDAVEEISCSCGHPYHKEGCPYCQCLRYVPVVCPVCGARSQRC